MNDDLFRYVLLAKIVQNSWDGTNENFKEIWDATMSGKMEASYYDNQDMSMDVKIAGPTEPLMVELLLHGYIVPKPLGVRMNINAIIEMVEDMSRAEGAATLNDAKIGVPLTTFRSAIQRMRPTLHPLYTGPVAIRSAAWSIRNIAKLRMMQEAALSSLPARAMPCAAWNIDATAASMRLAIRALAASPIVPG